MIEPVAFDVEKWDADMREYRPVLKQIRRLITLGTKAGKPWHAATTVGEVAEASKKEPAEVARLIKTCAYLVEAVETEAPVESWVVFEDGE